jgi:hypothetical protein
MSRLKAKPPPSANGRNGHADGYAGRHAPETVPADPKEGRDARGRFAKGWRGGPGAPANPFNRRVAELRRALVEALGEGGITRLVEALLRQVENNGDLAAAELLLSHTVGKPVKACHPDLVDDNEWDVRRKNPSPDFIARDLHRLPWGFAFSLSDDMGQEFMYRFCNQNFYGVGGGRGLKRVGEAMGDQQFAAWAEAHAEELLQLELYRNKQRIKEEKRRQQHQDGQPNTGTPS